MSDIEIESSIPKRQRTLENNDNDTSDEDDDFSFISEEIDKIKTNNKEIIDTFNQVQQELVRTEPDVKKLLLTPMLLENRVKLCQLYEIYKSLEFNTNERLEARENYIKMFNEYEQEYKDYFKYTDSEKEYIINKEKLYSCSLNSQSTLKYKIFGLHTNDKNKQIIYQKYQRMIELDHSDEEYGKLKQWLYWATNIPYDKMKEINVCNNITDFIKKAKDILDSELYGMEKAKEQILLYLSVRLLNPNTVNSNLAFIGPPGTGKTSIARLLSKLLGFGFAQISFGGTDKSDILKGHDYTYVGSQPGEIVKALKNIESKNGIIFLDELEKTVENPNIRTALLQIIDPSQNTEFTDFYLGDLTIDISKIWWICSMNEIPEDSALVDRLWIINVDGYSMDEKKHIIKTHLLPKTLKNCGIDTNKISFDSDIISYFINKVCEINDKGVRTLEKVIKDIVNKISFILNHQDKNGKLPFTTSFQLNYFISLPLIIDKLILDKLLNKKEFNNILSMMYL